MIIDWRMRISSIVVLMCQSLVCRRCDGCVFYLILLNLLIVKIARHIIQSRSTDGEQHLTELASVSRAMVGMYEHTLDAYSSLSFQNKRALGARFVGF
jgi:hypothetical protein